MTDQTPIPTPDDKTRWWLASLIMRRGDEVLPRFARVYDQLANRPRGWHRRLQRRLAVTVTGAAMLFALAGFSTWAAPVNEIAVVNGEVAIAANGQCSLIEAIENANDTDDGRPHNDCAAGNPSGPDVIVLPTGGTFNVSKSVNYYYGYSGLPLITSAVTVEGNGSTITRTGNKDLRFFTVVRYYENDTAALTLNDLTLTNGRNEYYNGGAIYTYGATLTINDCTITGNEAGGNGGAIFATYTDVTITNSTINDNKSYGGGGLYAGYGEVTILDSTISGNLVPDGIGGGAYLTAATVVMNNTTIQNNEAYSGAGLMLGYSELDVKNSVISDNTATENQYGGGDGGGLHIYNSTGTLADLQISGNGAKYGGGIFFYSGELTLKGTTLSNNQAERGGGLFVLNEAEVSVVNTTLSGNQAEEFGGGANSLGTLTFTNATLSLNTAGTSGGGLQVFEGATTLRQTLIAGNTAPTGREAFRQTGTVTVNSHNLFGFGANAGLSGITAGATDVVPGAGTTLAGVLGPLADNTGSTHTHALPPGSPAIDRAPSAACSAAPVGGYDQRGQPRNTDGNNAASANECDIGAFEYQPGGNVNTPTPTATVPVGPTPTPTATPPVGPLDEELFLPVVLDQ